MKRIKIFSLVALLLASPLLLAAGSGGFPSKPRFQEAFFVGNSGNAWVGNSSSTDGWLAIGAYHDGTNWRASATSAVLIGKSATVFSLATNSGLTIGNTFTPGTRFSLGSSGLTINVPLVSSRACAAGYTRVTPNYCHANTPTLTGLVRDVCTTDNSLPSDAEVAVVQTTAFAGTANSAADRSAYVIFHTSNTCAANLLTGSSAVGREFSAVAGSIVATDTNTSLIVLDASQDFFMKFTDDAGNLGQGYYGIVGYFD